MNNLYLVNHLDLLKVKLELLTEFDSALFRAYRTAMLHQELLDDFHKCDGCGRRYEDDYCYNCEYWCDVCGLHYNREDPCLQH